MRKFRKSLIGQAGFTLPEMLVVLIIILILAAVLTPRVTRYIESARESAFRKEASAYLTELSSYEAEWHIKTGKDLDNGSNGFTDKLPDGMKLTDWSENNKILIYNPEAEIEEGFKIPYILDGMKIIHVFVRNGAVIGYTYSNGKYGVAWFPDGGWAEVIRKKQAVP